MDNNFYFVKILSAIDNIKSLFPESLIRLETVLKIKVVS
jgi:hypothetical protein